MVSPDKQVNIGGRCPNCNSERFVETIAREFCPDCGLQCDYHGDGANEVYRRMMESRAAAEQRERDELDELG